MIGTNNQELITQVLESFSAENEALMSQLLEIQYFFRGTTRDDAWSMSRLEREKAIEFLNNRFKEVREIAKKTGQWPHY